MNIKEKIKKLFKLETYINLNALKTDPDSFELKKQKQEQEKDNEEVKKK